MPHQPLEPTGEAAPPLLPVSVITPVLNTPPGLLREAAASVLDGSGNGAAELVIVDDGTTEPATLEALEALSADPRVRLVRHGRRRGVAAARNTGLAAARHPWIGWCDGDDLWLEGWLSAASRAVALNPGADYLGARHVNESPEGLREPEESLADGVAARPAAGGACWLEGPGYVRRLIPVSPNHLGSTLTRAERLRAAGPFPEGVNWGEDRLVLLRLSAQGPMLYLDQPHYLWRRDRPSLTSSRRRLSGELCRSWALALRDPALAEHRRPIRWALYTTRKGTAINNLWHGRPAAALGHALRAWALDPREVGEMALFMKLMTSERAREGPEARRYSTYLRWVNRSDL